MVPVTLLAEFAVDTNVIKFPATKAKPVPIVTLIPPVAIAIPLEEVDL